MDRYIMIDMIHINLNFPINILKHHGTYMRNNTNLKRSQQAHTSSQQRNLLQVNHLHQSSLKRLLTASINVVNLQTIRSTIHHLATPPDFDRPSKTNRSVDSGQTIYSGSPLREIGIYHVFRGGQT
ncbi:hypothetical protein JTE90_009652 [Oedothorax gibbosus]|uniref:Uncharacterized protein n=1 Tax=Oedothorax gibbosus TaxID=931172 RepID=A0AAV6V9N9_9ARAC|nr:hypothetical protein JTE90_009652 [Oedothorax gibbosus]